ncbi:MAG: GGDEF domain-containing protein [Pseudonocardiales bacterium]|nr:GGDEF domain-containing protein [Pseudonocardiales bacterium]
MREARGVPGRFAAVRSRGWWPTRWLLWNLPGQLVLSVLTVEAAAVTLTVLLLVGGPGPLDATSTLHLAVVLLLALAHTEIARGAERLRRRISDDLQVDLSSTWLFVVAVLLPPGYAALAAVVIDAYTTMRSARARTHPHRRAFSTATLVLAVLAAGSAMRFAAGLGGPAPSGPTVTVPVLALGIMVFLVVNTALVAGAIALSNPRLGLADVVGEWDDNVLDIASYCLGALAAAALVVHPALAVLVLPPLLVLHRAALVRQLTEKASTDAKTGLLNAEGWHNRAERDLRRAERRSGPLAVLVVDLDHFKDVNDRHGHLAGDQVLAAVAGALRAEVRDHDVVGRFGGEEFVVLLGAPTAAPHQGGAELEAIAERIRRRIAALQVEMPTPDGPLTVAGLSVSVGAALYPDHGRDVRTLLHVADTALYAAKRAGRNAVRMGKRQLPAPAPEVRTI